MNDLPLLPGPTAFYHWDQHWIAWTPSDPAYEAIEVMTVERPGIPGFRLIWAFFTERAEPKRQVHYLSDAGVAARWRGEAHTTAFDFEALGPEGAARGLHLAFLDKNGRHVDWTLRFNGATPLAPVGLKDQSGHEAGRFFLLYFCALGLTTDSSRVTIDGLDIGCASPDAGGAPFIAAYGYNIYIASLIYGQWSVKWTSNAFLRSDGAWFARSGDGRDLTAALPGFGQRGVVRRDETDAVLGFEHHSFAHVMRWSFEPPIPHLGALRADFRGNFRISVDGIGDLAHGLVAAAEGCIAELRLTPRVQWARRPMLAWAADNIDPGGYSLRFIQLDG